MISDHITDVVSADFLITQLGLFVFRQYGLSQRQLTSSRIRMLSRLLIELRHSTKKSDLTLIKSMSPEYFNHNAVLHICQMEMNQNARPILNCSPSFALKIGHELRSCVELV